MRFRIVPAIFLGLIVCAFVTIHAADAAKKTARIEVQLLWGTDLDKSPNPKHKPLDSDVAHRIKALPLKFKNYFLVSKNIVEIPIGVAKKVDVSEKCQIELKNLDNLKFQATFFGKGKQVAQRTQELPLGDILVHGGNAPGSNAWLVVLKRIH